MTVTREEAQKLECRKAFATEWVGSNKGDIAIFHFPPCLADRCCHWRWSASFQDKMDNVQKGYCGLAGKPED